MKQIVLDTETTGLDPNADRIIEIACVELTDRIISPHFFHFYLNPEREIEAGALKVHGITQANLLNKPKFADIVDQLLNYIEGAELIIHNAAFDLSFLNKEISLLNKNMPDIGEYCTIFDTLKFARQRHPGQRNSLDALCKRYHVDNSQRDLHGALVDAKLLAQVYLAMTGGQVSLFEDITDICAPIQMPLQSEQNNLVPLRVIELTELEEKEHLKMLEFLKANSEQEIIWNE